MLITGVVCERIRTYIGMGFKFIISHCDWTGIYHEARDEINEYSDVRINRHSIHAMPYGGAVGCGLWFQSVYIGYMVCSLYPARLSFFMKAINKQKSKRLELHRVIHISTSIKFYLGIYIALGTTYAGD